MSTILALIQLLIPLAQLWLLFKIRAGIDTIAQAEDRKKELEKALKEFAKIAGGFSKGEA